MMTLRGRYSFQTLIMMLTGEYGYEPVQKVDQLGACVFYTLYLLLVFFILVNMFLAIVMDAVSAGHPPVLSYTQRVDCLFLATYLTRC